MKKRIPALFLALALCMGLAVPAFAADKTQYPQDYEEAFQDVTVSYTLGGGRYEWSEWPHRMYLTGEGFVPDHMDPDGFGGLVELNAGESVQFELPAVYDEEEAELTDVIYEVRVEKNYPDFTEEETGEDGNTYPFIPGFYTFSYYKVDEECVDETVAELPFDDVRLGVYYDLPVIWAVKNEITKGTSPTAFSPAETCTQAQILTFLWRAYQK